MTYKLTTKEGIDTCLSRGLSSNGAVTRLALTLMASLAEKLMAERDAVIQAGAKIAGSNDGPSQVLFYAHKIEAEAMRILEKESK